MKKLLCIATAMLLFGCSSDDSSDGNQNLVSFEVAGYHEYNTNHIELVDWSLEILNNGITHRYTISAIVDREGVDNPNEAHPSCWFSISFDVLEPIQVNQTISINDITEVEGVFPTNDAPLTTISYMKPCDHTTQAIYMQPEISSNTSGEIKITAINGNKISGTFFFNNLSNFYHSETPWGGNWYESENCGIISAPVAPTTFNISNGSFNNVPKVP